MLILKKIKKMIVSFTPEFVILFYHLLIAVIFHIITRNPSKELIVIGVTGTKGKTTTSILIHTALSASGEKVGLLSTAEIRIGDKIIPNMRHMTMPGRGFVQKELRKMVESGCKYAVVEVPSEGLRQFRDFGIQYDSVVFTNISSEHLVTHKTFEKYRDAKAKLFKRHNSVKRKKIIDKKSVERYALLNADAAHIDHFKDIYKSDINNVILFGLGTDATYEILIDKLDKSNSFCIDGEKYTVPLPGIISVRNSFPGIFFAKKYCNVSTEDLNKAFNTVVMPGRLEKIDVGQPFHVFCDYAHEPLSVASVYDALKQYAKEGGKIIMVVGAVGGSRWKYNGVDIGRTATKYADITVITDVDPFFDDPKEIIDEVVKGAKENKGAVYYSCLDRRDGINKALSLAREGDVVIVTGKGAEFTMEIKGRSIKWDERKIIKEEIEKVIKN